MRGNFGPITNENGYRRLNVLYTRSKKRIDVITAMTSADVRVTERSSRGTVALKGYLEYAATGRLNPANRTSVRNRIRTLRQLSGGRWCREDSVSTIKSVSRDTD